VTPRGTGEPGLWWRRPVPARQGARRVRFERCAAVHASGSGGGRRDDGAAGRCSAGDARAGHVAGIVSLSVRLFAAAGWLRDPRILAWLWRSCFSGL